MTTINTADIFSGAPKEKLTFCLFPCSRRMHVCLIIAIYKGRSGTVFGVRTRRDKIIRCWPIATDRAGPRFRVRFTQA